MIDRARKIKVKVVVTLDDKDTYCSEQEDRFDDQMVGSDLAEATIKVASEVVSDVVKELVK